MLFVVSLLSGLFICERAGAQIVLSGTTYSQHFNSIHDGLPAGWSVWEDATATSLGALAAFETNATSWADTSPEFRNCASLTNNSGLRLTNAAAMTQQSFTNRVLAVRQGGSFGDPGAAFVFQATHTLGLSNLQFSVDCLMLDEENRETPWTVDYGIGAAPTNFTPLGTYTNTAPIGTIPRPTYSLGPDANDQPELLTIRVVALDGSNGSGSRDTFGIDNVRLTFNGTESPPAALTGKQIGETLVLTWDDASFGLQSAPTPGGVFTNVAGATSPHTSATEADQRYFRLAR